MPFVIRSLLGVLEDGPNLTLLKARHQQSKELPTETELSRWNGPPLLCWLNAMTSTAAAILNPIANVNQLVIPYFAELSMPLRRGLLHSLPM